ncbi:MAG: hypothetical protein FWH11_00525 [Micrococcales bacterium]|nr:hypothetical protein [Micrococcales bacterium]
MTAVPYPPPGPYSGYPSGYRPVKIPRPRTVKVLVTLGIVFGSLAVVCGAVGMVGAFGMTLDRHQFDGGRLSVRLEADRVYEIKETLARYDRVYLGDCTFTGPDEAHGTLTPMTMSSSSGYSREYTAYTFVTDTAGTYDFRCRHTDSRTRASAPFVLQPQSHPTDWMVFGLPLTFLVFLPACLATLIPGLVQRSRLKRYQAWSIGPGAT